MTNAETPVIWNDTAAAFRTLGDASPGNDGSPFNGAQMLAAAGFWDPDVPPPTASADDDEFSGSALDSKWNLHSTVYSLAPVIWTPAPIDENTADATDVSRYSINNPSNPSAFIWQPPANINAFPGMARKLDSGAVPTDWTMQVGISFGVNRVSPVSPDITFIIFMANDAPGNGYGDWDWQNWVGFYFGADYSGMVGRAAKTVGGSFSALGVSNFTIGDVLSDPMRWQIKKAGDLYNFSVRCGQKKVLLQSHNLASDGLQPVRFGIAIQSLATPNAPMIIRYVRHRFDANTF